MHRFNEQLAMLSENFIISSLFRYSLCGDSLDQNYKVRSTRFIYISHIMNDPLYFG